MDESGAQQLLDGARADAGGTGRIGFQGLTASAVCAGGSQPCSPGKMGAMRRDNPYEQVTWGRCRLWRAWVPLKHQCNQAGCGDVGIKGGGIAGSIGCVLFNLNAVLYHGKLSYRVGRLSPCFLCRVDAARHLNLLAGSKFRGLQQQFQLLQQIGTCRRRGMCCYFCCHGRVPAELAATTDAAVRMLSWELTF